MSEGYRDPKVGIVLMVVATIFIIPLMLPSGFGVLSLILGVLSVVAFVVGTLILGTSEGGRPV